MEDIQLLELVEQYVEGTLQGEELENFERLRHADPRTARFISEHISFLQNLVSYSDSTQLQNTLNEVHDELLAVGNIKPLAPKTKVIDLWRRYRRVVAVAALIGGITALSISAMFVYLTPKANKSAVEQLSRKLNKLQQDQNMLTSQINSDRPPAHKIPTDVNVQSGGTSFLIDAKGYLVTNAHVIGENANVVVVNTKGQEFKATIVRIDPSTDLAILKIDDPDFKPSTVLPYGFKKSGADLGEEIFTLGFPRDEIVYGEGYMSAKTGFNGDTLACQIAVAANPGNSGGPVINKNGEVIGILSTRQVKAEGVVFAVKTKNIFKALDEVKQSDTAFQNIKLNPASSLRGMDRTQQIKKIEDCVFMVKTY